MGTALPTAIGVSFAKSRLPVFCSVGDGGMHMYPAEIKTAVEASLPLCVILMTDGGYASIASAAAKSSPRHAFSIGHPSWWRAIEAMGCEARPVGSVSEFERALSKWERTAPIFLEAPFAAESYLRMTEGVR